MVWAQKYPRNPANNALGGSAHKQVALHLSSLYARQKAAASPRATAPAAGVAQCHLDANGALSAFFINTAAIPSGSTITGSITLLDDNSAIDFSGQTLSQALPAGSFVVLPAISNFGDLFGANGAALDIAVQVQSPQGNTQVECEVLLAESFANSDLASNEPLISAVSQKVAANKDLILVLNGYFTPDKVLAVMTDFFAGYVVPPSAINLVSSSEIDLDLSLVSGLDLSSSDTLFLTVSQDGFSDTVEYRYLPGPPGFNPAPQ